MKAKICITLFSQLLLGGLFWLTVIVLERYDRPEDSSNSQELNQSMYGDYYSNHGDEQGGHMFWSNNGSRWKIIPDMVQAQEVNSVTDMPPEISSIALESEPFDFDDYMDRLATIPRHEILVMTEEDSAMFMDTASLANIQSVKWVR